MQAAAGDKPNSNTRRRCGKGQVAVQADAVVLPRLKFEDPVERLN